jgi:hypothetical protein
VFDAFDYQILTSFSQMHAYPCPLCAIPRDFDAFAALRRRGPV